MIKTGTVMLYSDAIIGCALRSQPSSILKVPFGPPDEAATVAQLTALCLRTIACR
jgi:hypothetical protein